MREGRRTHQIHLVERFNIEWWDRHLLFRDYLRADPPAPLYHSGFEVLLLRVYRH
jgi:hypothetical protein